MTRTRAAGLVVSTLTVLGLVGLVGPVQSVGSVGLVGAAAAAAPTPGDADASAPRGGRIAFVRGGSIFVINPNGTGLRQLTKGPHDSNPEWSWEGDRVAYIHGDGHGGADLWMINDDGSDPVALTTSGEVRRGRIAWGEYGVLVFSGPCDADRVCDEHTGPVLDVMGVGVGPPWEFYTVADRQGVPIPSDGGVGWLPVLDLYAYEVWDGKARSIETIDPFTLDHTVEATCGGPGSECVGYFGSPTFGDWSHEFAYDAYVDQRGTRKGDYAGIYRTTLDGQQVKDFKQSAGDHYLTFSPIGTTALQRDAKRDGASPWIVVADELGKHRTRLCRGMQPAWGAA